MGLIQVIVIFVILVTVVAILRGWDVRLVLFIAALICSALAGQYALPVKVFLETFSNEKFVIPICSAMGFAYVLRLTGCDQDLVRLLTAPLRSLKWILIPSVVLVGFIVNIPVISQTSTVVCLGPVVVPLLRAAKIPPVVIASALALGSSMGGELLNPGAPELLTVRNQNMKDGITIDTKELAWNHILPLLVPMIVVATLAFWLQSLREMSRARSQAEPANLPVITSESNPDTPETQRIHYLRAVVPLLPVMLLFMTGPPLNLITLPTSWLADKAELASSRLIGAAMLLGVFMAVLANPWKVKECAKQFFEGAGYGFATIISLIVTANCFGNSIKAVGLADLMGKQIAAAPGLLVPLAAAIPCTFAAICGSGMATTQSLYVFFHDPAAALGQNTRDIGAIVSLASAAGRTMSPVSAVVLMSAMLNGVTPFAVVKRVAGPLLLGLVVVVGLRLGGFI